MNASQRPAVAAWMPAATSGTALHARVTRVTSAEELAQSRLVAAAVRRAQQGDQNAIGFLYARYADNVCGYVRSIVGDEHEAEDITQHVFAKLIDVIGKYEEREVPFLSWVLRVSRNAALDHIRRRRAIPVKEVRIAERGDGQLARQRAADLREALAALPADQREVLTLRHVVGLRPSEIALQTGRTEASVHGLHHRGRKAMKADLIGRGCTPITSEH